MLYDYECTQCGHVFEVEQSIKADVRATCPKCSHETTKRLISTGTRFVLKGSCWASDGYSSK